MTTIIFDFDGVLADTFDTVVDLVHEQGHTYGVHLKNPQALRDLPLKDVLTALKVPVYKVPFLSKKVKTELNKRIKTVNTFTGIKPALNKLSKHAQLGILSSNAEKSISAFLRKHAMKKHFAFVFTDTPVFGKAHMLKHVLREHALDKNKVIYVCDQIVDIAAAKKAGIRVAAVGWGYNSARSLRKEQPDFFIRTPADLSKLK